MAHKDKYTNFTELARYEREDTDYRIQVLEYARHPAIVILSPHGGGIEPHTSTIAAQIAGDDFCLYLFEGIKPHCNFETLHITSTRFDEPNCVRLVERAEVAVAIHGKGGADERAAVGGLDAILADEIVRRLNEAEFDARREMEGRLSGRNVRNICNRTAAGEGVQIELTWPMRCQLVDTPDRLFDFSGAVRRAIETRVNEV